MDARALSYSLGTIADVIAYQSFTFLVFTFYFSVVGVTVDWMFLGFVLWSIWNAINDPIFGVLSDSTETRWGRRYPYIAATIVPLSLMMYLLWTPPIHADLASFLYFIIAIFAFDGIYTLMSLNLTSLFPELFRNPEERANVNVVRQVFGVVGLVIAFILPTIFIEDVTYDLQGYQRAGVVMGFLVFSLLLICLRFGCSEKGLVRTKRSESVLREFTSIGKILRKRPFVTYALANFLNWYVFGILASVVPLYCKFVLNIPPGETFLTGLVLGCAFIVAALVIPLWQKAGLRLGSRRAFMISTASFILGLLPFLFATDVTGGFIAAGLTGVGLAGALYFRDIMISEVIDEDEYATWKRREGVYFGINGFLIRLGAILTYFTIALVFMGTGWTEYTPRPGVDVVFGLRLLMSVFPIVALASALLFLYAYPLKADRLMEIRQKLRERTGERV